MCIPKINACEDVGALDPFTWDELDESFDDPDPADDPEPMENNNDPLEYNFVEDMRSVRFWPDSPPSTPPRRNQNGNNRLGVLVDGEEDMTIVDGNEDEEDMTIVDGTEDEKDPVMEFFEKNPLLNRFLHIFYEERVLPGRNIVVFSTYRNRSNTFRAVLDAQKCLEGTKKWELNKVLLAGKKILLTNCVLNFLDKFKMSHKRLIAPTDVFFKADISRKDNLVMKSGDEAPTIYFPLFETKIFEKLFWKMLKKEARPKLVLQNRKLNNCLLVAIHDTGFIELALESSLYLRIKEILDKNAMLIEDPDDEHHYNMYAGYIDIHKGKSFIARLDNRPGSFYRTKIVEEVTVKPLHRELTLNDRKFKVEYIDIGLTRILSFKEFACIGTSSKLPPLLHKLPPQVIKCYPKNVSADALAANMVQKFELQGDLKVFVEAGGIDDLDLNEIYVTIYPRVPNVKDLKTNDCLNHRWNKVHQEKKKQLRQQDPHTDLAGLAMYYLNRITGESEKCHESELMHD